jgi:hypothetical protein
MAQIKIEEPAIYGLAALYSGSPHLIQQIGVPIEQLE